MSIPPLVCSTPPPPEQCEEDKDPDDFVLHYSLSQEDDENNDCNYGNFTTYDNYQSSAENNRPQPDILDIKIERHCENMFDASKSEDIEKGSKIVLEEEEDLNLKVDEEPENSNLKMYPRSSEKDVDEIAVTGSGFQTDILTKTNNDDRNEFSLCSPNDKVLNVDLCSVENNGHGQISNTEDAIMENPTTSNSNTKDVIIEDPREDCDIDSNEIVYKTFITEADKNKDSNTKRSEKEFEDFDDFQFVSSDMEKTQTIIDSPENPWDSRVSDDATFGDFTANFENNDENALNPNTFVAEFPNESTSSVAQKKADCVINYNAEDNDDDDDFGDFDEFKSSVVEDKTSTDAQDLPVINLHSTDSEQQIIERFNKVLQSVFSEEISGADNDFESKLDVSLGETWVYLKETDVRQPYIVNWNSSLAQKTLLKALCIDSRNILFGSKRSMISMPKYAANLSAAPLQPQKQGSQLNQSLCDPHNSEKASNKTAWSDSLASDGQESCNNESGSSVIEAGPTELDVFEAAKGDKIFSSTLNVQPIRQINLPDTHIFTPTDSEIPRSKTIHYASGQTPTLLMPQLIISSAKNQTENYTPQGINTDNNLDSKYWEFQDFRGAAVNSPSNDIGDQEYMNKVSSATNKDTPNVTYETQVLQPIKVELTMPTLNWPDPGEVKETFDDFTDFISNTSPTKKTQESVSKHQDAVDLCSERSVLNVDPSSGITETQITEANNKPKTIDNFNDDFDMFQSAPIPVASASKDMPKFDFISSVSSPVTQALTKTEPTKFSDFDIAFLKSDKEKSTHISFENTRPIDEVTNNIDSTSIKSLPISTSISSMINHNMLKPTPSSNSSKQTQKSGQILQPLSLESYSQINWPNPGIDLQDLSRFNPVETLQSLKTDLNSQSKHSSPVHTQKSFNINQPSDDDIWGDFVSSKPKQQQAAPKKPTACVDDDEWTDFISSPSVNPQNGLNTISFNVYTNSSNQKTSNSSKFALKTNDVQLEIPTLNYITPKTASEKSYNDRHFQNL